MNTTELYKKQLYGNKNFSCTFKVWQFQFNESANSIPVLPTINYLQQKIIRNRIVSFSNHCTGWYEIPFFPFLCNKAGDFQLIFLSFKQRVGQGNRLSFCNQISQIHFVGELTDFTCQGLLFQTLIHSQVMIRSNFRGMSRYSLSPLCLLHWSEIAVPVGSFTLTLLFQTGRHVERVDTRYNNI